MTWLSLSVNEWRRRPLRTGVTAMGVAIAVAAVFSMLAFQAGYRDGMRTEIDRLGAHVLAVPKGCPYDAASIALHGANWPCYLKSSYLEEVRRTPGVAAAAPHLMTALYHDNRSLTVYIGADEQLLALKPGWKIQGHFPRNAGELLIGSDLARQQKWQQGEHVTLPGLSGEKGSVAGIIGPTGGADDAFIYARLEDAQRWFGHRSELTHILVRLNDPNALDQTVRSLRGCDAGMDMNIVPLAHLFRTIQALVNSTRLLLGCAALIGLLVAATGVSNAMLMSVAERDREIGILRAIGASRAHVFGLIFVETIQVCVAGSIAGVLLAFASSRVTEAWLRSRLPFAPSDPLISWEWWIAAACVGGAIVLGSVAALLPASRAVELMPAEAMRQGARA